MTVRSAEALEEALMTVEDGSTCECTVNGKVFFLMRCGETWTVNAPGLDSAVYCESGELLDAVRTNVLSPSGADFTSYRDWAASLTESCTTGSELIDALRRAGDVVDSLDGIGRGMPGGVFLPVTVEIDRI